VQSTMTQTTRTWVGRVAVAVLLAVVGLGARSVVAQTTGAPPSARRPAAPHAVSPAAYPTPVEETYQGCPPQGDGGDTALNLLKNRIDTAAWQPATLPSLLSLTWPRAVEKARRSDWAPADAATVARPEGRPVVAEGDILLVRHEGPESPNCHDATQRDYHVWLGASATTSRAHALIVELAPRVVALHPGWGTEAALLGLKGRHVRIAGWLMFDQEHPEQVGRTRGSLWEIHPVMRLAVDQGGRWVDLDTGRPAANVPPLATTPPPTPPTVAPSSATGALRVAVVVQPNPTAYGTETTVRATTAPGAACGVRVVYASGTTSTSRALRTTQTASAAGSVAWTWRYGSHTSGQGRATVTCALGSRHGAGSATVTVG